MHSCSGGESIHGKYGPAIEACFEVEISTPMNASDKFLVGQFVVTNDEYSNAVNFCPFCGVKAPVPASGKG